MGENIIKTGDKISFSCELPLKSEVRLIRNSVSISKKNGFKVDFTVDQPGIYRVEIYRKRRPWIYSNPIRVIENGNYG